VKYGEEDPWFLAYRTLHLKTLHKRAAPELDLEAHMNFRSTAMR
jgi:hypothetical protein